MKTEYFCLMVTFLVLIVVFKIAFFKEDIFTIIKIVVGFLFLFTIPGMIIISLLRKNKHEISFVEKLLFGTLLGIALILVVVYNLNNFGISLKYSNYVAVVYVLLIAAIGIYARKISLPKAEN